VAEKSKCKLKKLTLLAAKKCEMITNKVHTFMKTILGSILTVLYLTRYTPFSKDSLPLFVINKKSPDLQAFSFFLCFMPNV